MYNYLKKNKGLTACYAILFIYMLVHLWLARYSSASPDEAYYYAMPIRLLQGDIMFLEAWELHQTSAVIIMPLVWLYRCFVADLQGLILFMRMLFVLVHFFVALQLFKMLKFRFTNVVALITSLLYVSAVLFLIGAFSYNTMPTLFIAYTIGVIFDDPNKKRRLMHLSIAGFFFALSIPAYPYFIVLIFFIIIAGLFMLIRKRDILVLYRKSILYFILGACVAGMLYLIFFLTNSSFSNLINNFEYMQDPYHPYKGMFYPFKIFVIELFNSLALVHGLGVKLFSLGILITSFVLACVYRFSKNNKYRLVLLCVILLSLCFVVVLQTYGIAHSTLRLQSQMNYYSMPCLLISPTVWMLTCDKKSTIYFSVIVGVSLVNALVIQYGSTTELEGASGPLILCSLAVIPYLYCVIAQWKGNTGILTLVLLVACISFSYYAFSLSRHQILSTYTDGSLLFCDTKIENGPSAGLLTTKEKADFENGRYTFIKQHLPKGGFALFLDEYPEGYLLSDLRVSPQSVWTSKINIPVSQLYYGKHQERLPNFVYIQNEEFMITQDIYDNLTANNAKVWESQYGKIYVYE